MVPAKIARAGGVPREEIEARYLPTAKHAALASRVIYRSQQLAAAAPNLVPLPVAAAAAPPLAPAEGDA